MQPPPRRVTPGGLGHCCGPTPTMRLRRREQPRKSGCPLQTPVPRPRKRTLVPQPPCVAGGAEGGDGPSGVTPLSGGGTYSVLGCQEGKRRCWGAQNVRVLRMPGCSGCRGAQDAGVLSGVSLMDGSVWGGVWEKRRDQRHVHKQLEL